jgi:hypothetical protein
MLSGLDRRSDLEPTVVSQASSPGDARGGADRLMGREGPRPGPAHSPGTPKKLVPSCVRPPAGVNAVPWTPRLAPKMITG